MNKKPYLLEMPEQLHTDTKTAAAKTSRSMKDFILKAVERAIAEANAQEHPLKLAE